MYPAPNNFSNSMGGTDSRQVKLVFLDVVDYLDPRERDGGVSEALVWFNHLERILLAYDDLQCAELLKY